MHKYIYLFIIFLLYQTSSFSKISDVNKFDQKNLSNYFSAVLSINNNDAKNSLKFLENSKILNNRHEEHFKNSEWSNLITHILSSRIDSESKVILQ